MPRGHIHRLEYIYVGAAIATALLVQRADLRRPPRDISVPIAVLRPAGPEPEESFRLAPDRRLLIAVGDLHQLLGGSPGGAADARFDGERWHITHDGIEVGTLPEVPDYPDLAGLLKDWAVRLGADSVINAPGITGDSAPLEAGLRQLEALRAADVADRRWSVGERGRGLFELGARAVILLELMNTDQVEASDRLAARALALMAACQALDPAALERESCLLAHHLGYGAYARELAGRLSPYDPVRAYVRGEDARLEALALQRRATPETRFLHLTRSRSADVPLPAPLSVLLAVERDRMEIGVASAPDTAAGLAGAVGEEAPLSAVVNAFERRMEAMPPVAGGFFLDRELLTGYWRGSFYSALRTALELPGRTTSTATDPLAGVRAGVGVEFAAWARHVADGGSSPQNRVALTADLGALPHFGAPLRFEAYEALSGVSPAPEIASRRAAQRLAERLDSRPAHRARFGRIAFRNLLDLPLGEELFASAARAGAPLDCELEAWWSERTGDRARLESLLARPGLTWAEETSILEHYQALPGVDTATVCRAYRRCMAGHPGSWRLLASYAGYLERQRAWVPARTSIHGWLDRNDDRAGLDGITARTTLARLYEDQGRYAEAFAAVASVVSSQQPEAMACAVRLLEALGRTSQAETLAVFAAERAPDTGRAQAQAAELFWRHGKPGAAARLLTSGAGTGAPDHWRTGLGPRFARCFAARAAAGQSAVDSLLATGRIPAESIADLAAAAADSGAWELASQVESRVHPAPARRIEHLLSLYRYLGHTRGETEATAWLGPRLQGASAAELAQVQHRAFSLQDDGLLWSVASDTTGASAEYPWLLRAAAALRRGDHGGVHARDLAWHFAAPDRGHDRMLGRFLLGLADESTILGLGGTRAETCEAFYFVGFKAQTEGRCRDAAAWYARGLATHATSRPEFRWAYDQLLAWSASGLSLERIESAVRRTPA